jgi:UPF0755 protein
MFKKLPFYPAIFIAASLFGIFFMIIFSPLMVAKKTVISVESSQSARLTIQDLKDHHIISSAFLLRAYMKITGKDKRIIPGDYLFSGEVSLAGAGNRLSSGDFEIKQERVVIPEGSSVKDIGQIIQKTYPDFDTKAFLSQAKNDEGYLFPDSYDLFESTSTADVINLLKENFNVKTKDLKAEAEALGLKWNDVIILASLLEEEGKTEADREIISDILHKRLNADIPLQVDSTFQYINGKTTKDLTLSDLKINSPYNTYVHTGLPPTPISNPGLESIRAAIRPESTDYLYFLTDDNGVMRYSKTFEEHVANKKKYLTN